MPRINEPDYAKVEQKCLNILRIYKPDCTEADKAVALVHLKVLWPSVIWTNSNNVTVAARDAANYAISKARKEPGGGKRKRVVRVKSPPNDLTASLAEPPKKDVDDAFVDAKVDIDAE